MRGVRRLGLRGRPARGRTVHACAASAACIANGWCESPVTVHLAGGDLLVELGARARRRLTGPAEEVHGRARRGVCAVRFAKRLDAVPPYLFAELDRKIAEGSAAGST